MLSEKSTKTAATTPRAAIFDFSTHQIVLYRLGLRSRRF